jgi:uncharacterized protein YegJ (DUF2314 family)
MLTLANFLPAALVLALLTSSSLSAPLLAAPPAGEDEGPVVNVRTDDPKMNAAIAEARRTLPEFLAALADPPPGVTGFSFKYPLAGHEHIWVDHVERRGDRLVGRLVDTPLEPGYREGQRVTVPIGQVSDWAYRDARGVMQGHRTTRVLLPHLDPAHRRQIREGFGWSRPRAIRRRVPHVRPPPVVLPVAAKAGTQAVA